MTTLTSIVLPVAHTLAMEAMDVSQDPRILLTAFVDAACEAIDVLDEDDAFTSGRRGLCLVGGTLVDSDTLELMSAIDDLENIAIVEDACLSDIPEGFVVR